MGAFYLPPSAPTGKTLVSGGTDEQVILWDVRHRPTNRRAARGRSNAVRTGVFTTNGTKLITGDSDGRALVWDVGMTHELGGHDDRVHAMLLSPDERTLVSAGFDKQIIVRDTTTFEILKKVATEHQNAILNAAFSPDGRTSPLSTPVACQSCGTRQLDAAPCTAV